MQEIRTQLVFGEITLKEAERLNEPNPCVRLYGRDAYGRTCATCRHLHAHAHGRRYYKCDLRKETCGPGTDHRVKWSACGKYERRT